MNIVHHLGINCRDRKAQEAFYTEHLGLKPARVFNRGQAGEFTMLRLGGMCLEFFDAKETQGHGGEQPVGFKHLAFEVPDLDAVIAKLNAAGTATGEIIDASKHVPGLRICFFNDPEGNIIELMQGWQDE